MTEEEVADICAALGRALASAMVIAGSGGARQATSGSASG